MRARGDSAVSDMELLLELLVLARKDLMAVVVLEVACC